VGWPFCFSCTWRSLRSHNENAMVTDTPPRKTNSAGFLESDRIKTHWPDLREIERQAKSLGVLPQSFNGNFAQSAAAYAVPFVKKKLS
jgi:hypothetical protein